MNRFRSVALFVLALLAIAPAGLSAQPARVEVAPSRVEIEVDGTVQIRAVAFDEEGRRISEPQIFWVSPNENVTVDQTGRITAVMPGTAVVAAVVQGVAGVISVTVAQVPPDELLVEDTMEVPAGSSRMLYVAGRTRFGEIVEIPDLTIETSAPGVATVDAVGRIVGVSPGDATLSLRAGDAAASVVVRVVPNAAVAYELRPGAAEVLTGDVIRLWVVGRTDDGTELAGFEPNWSISGRGAIVESEGEQGVFVAEEPGTYIVTATIGPGASESVVIRAEPRARSARLIKVGRGAASTHRSGDTWVFEGIDGRDYAYIGTFYHDWMKVWDVTDPSSPILTDSVQVDARRINDVKIHPNSRLGIITREGASSRRNGIVLLDLSQPAHPTILSEYTSTVTGGVHNVWVYGEEDLIYACHNGTSEIHIIDIADPTSPREVGKWGLDKQFKTLHDVIVQDGYAYLSYWDDGLITLDAGAGTHGGTPTNPTFVSQYRYPIGHTHTAWRHGRYLFVGDEIYPDDWDPEAFGPIEARGYVHVLDMTDMDAPIEVAKYEVPEAGAHNLWTDDQDRLYVGYYQAGLRVVDISGELRGDLYRQGREIAALKTTDDQTTVPNWPMTWGAQLHKGNIFTSDLFSGLWIARLVESELVP